MTDHESLRRLAQMVGIEPSYWDIQGNYHETSPETVRSLLSALSFQAGDATEVEASLSALHEKQWRRILPPVMVILESERASVSVHLPAEVAETGIDWRISEEGGGSHSGIFYPAAVHLEETYLVEGHKIERRRLELPPNLPVGYHELRVGQDAASVMQLIVTPGQCFLPPELAAEGRRWGIATHLYAVRSTRNWGIGDFTDLTDLLEKAATFGAVMVGLNPLHALFPSNPEAASPYSPSSRLFLNPLYLDVEAIPDFAECPGTQNYTASSDFVDRLRDVRGAPFVDYTAVTHLKYEVLERLFSAFRRNHLGPGEDARASDFLHFKEDGGDQLRRFAIFEAVSEARGSNCWADWPPEFRDPTSRSVEIFAEDRRNRIEFFQYIQWQADLQLARASRRAEELGMAIGLYRDLAVSADPNGAATWSAQDVFVQEARIGAPPDPFNALGQNWGTPPLHPLILRDKAYAPFIALLRANMRHAGALRIDHVMGLKHLFWVPSGQQAAPGAYVEYPFDDMLGILALESQRNHCLVVGEDLGTVPEGFRARMATANVLSCRVLYFEQHHGQFKQLTEYPPLSAASVSTHDLPTIIGFWRGTDIAAKFTLGLYPSKEAHADEENARARDRRNLLQALARVDLLPPSVNLDDPDSVTMSPDLAAAVHQYLARSPARLLVAQLDDLVGEDEQINLPGTVLEYPNWRRKLSRDLEVFADDSAVRDFAAKMDEEGRRAP